MDYFFWNEVYEEPMDKKQEDLHGSKKAGKKKIVDAKFLRAKHMDLKLSKSGLRMSIRRLDRF